MDSISESGAKEGRVSMEGLAPIMYVCMYVYIYVNTYVPKLDKVRVIKRDIDAVLEFVHCESIWKVAAPF